MGPRPIRFTLLVIAASFAVGMAAVAIVAGTATRAAATPPPSPGGPIVFPQPGQMTTVNGNLETPGEQDNWTFTVASRSTAYFRWVSPSINPWMWRLRDSDTGRVYFEGGVGVSDPYVLPPGRYTITLKANEGGSWYIGGSAGEYAFEVWSVPTPPTGSIGLNGIVTDSIGSPGQENQYTFVLGAPAQVIPTVLSQTGDGRCRHWNLRDHQGRILFDQGLTTLPSVYLPAAAYTLTVSSARLIPTGNGPWDTYPCSVGTYQFQLATTVPSPPPPTPELNTFTLCPQGQACPLHFPPPGTSQTISGHIQTVGAQDAYAFQGLPGQQLFLHRLAWSDPALEWELRQPDGSLMFQADWSDNNYDLNHDRGPTDAQPTGMTLPLAGPYWLVVYDKNGQGNDIQYSFTLTVVSPAQSFPITLPIAAGQSVDVANGSITSNGVAAPVPGAGNIEAFGSRDFYTFQATTGQLLYLQSESGTNMRWNLRDPSGRIVRWAPLGYYDIGAFRVPRSGTYSVEVFGWAGPFGGNGAGGCAPFSGTYSFRIWGVASPEPPTPIALNATVQGSVATPGVVHMYAFTATAGQQVSFTGSASGPSLSWRLRDPLGLAIPVNNTVLGDQGWWGVNGPYTLPRSGPYTILVYPTTSATGTYSFSLVSGGATGTTAPLPDVFSGVDVGDPISPDSPLPGAAIVNPGAVQEYQIAGISGDAVFFDYETCGYPLGWNLVAPDGTVLFDEPVGQCDQDVLVLPDTGTYLLRVNSPLTEVTQHTFTLTLWHDVTMQEPPRPGQGSRTPALTRVDPPSAPTGGTATITVFGTNLAEPTAVHVHQGSGPDLPTSLLDAHGVNTNVEAEVATARIDFTNAAIGDYTVTVDFADGTSRSVPFTVTDIEVQLVTASVDAPGMDALGLTRAFLLIPNSGNSDFYDLPLILDVPPARPGVCNEPVWNPHHTAQLIGGATLETPPLDDNRIIQFLQTLGVPQQAIDTFQTLGDQTTELATLGPDGHCRLFVWVPVIPSHSEAVIPISFTPEAATPPGDPYPILDVSEIPGDHRTPGSPNSPSATLVRTLFENEAAAGVQPMPSDAGIDGVVRNLIQLAHEIPLLVIDALDFARLANGIVGAGGDGMSSYIRGVGPTNALGIGVASGGGRLLVRQDMKFVSARDPNDLTGVGTEAGPNPTGPGGRMTMTARFENEDTANGSAKDVRVHLCEVDASSNCLAVSGSAVDWSTLRVESVDVGGVTVDLTQTNTTSSTGTALEPFAIQQTYPWTVAGSTAVKVGAQFDSEAGSLDVRFTGPPETDFVHHPLGGYRDFLAPNVTPPRGQGSITFSVATRSDAALGTAITMQGFVDFDGTITPTNTWTYTLMAPPPQVRAVHPKALSTGPGRVTVTWRAPFDRTGQAAPITSYAVVGRPFDRRTRLFIGAPFGATVDATQLLTTVFTNLDAGYYKFTVTANSEAGSGPSSKAKKRRVY